MLYARAWSGWGKDNVENRGDPFSRNLKMAFENRFGAKKSKKNLEYRFG
jgi:hypothetical protein